MKYIITVEYKTEVQKRLNSYDFRVLSINKTAVEELIKIYIDKGLTLKKAICRSIDTQIKMEYEIKR